MSQKLAIGAALAAGVLLAGTWGYTQFAGGSGDELAECRIGNVAGGAGSIGGPFELVDETGKTVTDKDVITKPTLLYFGYTFCPDVCPLDSARNGEAAVLLEERGVDVGTVFVSIDPERDTPESLAEFTDVMHPEMLGLTGTPEQVKAASMAYRTYYKKQEPEEGDEEFYLVDHSTFTYLVTPEQGFIDFFKRDESPEQMADRVQCFIDRL
ncbi:SCO family protein [Lentibacter sp. XHP0401]|uniref:SCO family protein n=1 Tax=Lentibacter sp. XHP0401 TaxID=2984334 RepID=UPI0021E7895A|nr:SCO family protein [Lentibacter sp. XHP0401]MCV2892645.1 SCO family protein [Lentibacter sp. XHP0401]